MLSCDAMYRVCEYVEMLTLCAIAGTCTVFHAAATDDTLWGPIFRTRFRRVVGVRTRAEYVRLLRNKRQVLTSEEGREDIPHLSLLSRLSSWFRRSYEGRFLLVGLDAAGKSTIQYLAGQEEPFRETHLYSLNIEIGTIQNSDFISFDLSWHLRQWTRGFFRLYFPSTRGVVFVIDSNDVGDRHEELVTQLGWLAEEMDLRGVPFLLLCNKQDLPSADVPENIVETLRVRVLLRGRPWRAQGCVATQLRRERDAFVDGIEWLKKYARKCLPPS